MDFTIYSEGEAYPRGWLKRQFYIRNRFQSEKWDGTKYVAIANPIGRGEFASDFLEVNTFVYTKGYYVTVEQGSSPMHGPHVAKLYLRMKGYDNPIWLGTAQFEGSFYDDKGILKQLRLAIKRREYFCSAKSAEEMFEVRAEGDLVVVEDAIEEDELPLSTSRGKKRKRVELRVGWWRNHVGVFCYDPVVCPLCGVKKRRIIKLEEHFRRKHPKKYLGIQWYKTLDKSVRKYYNGILNGRTISTSKQGRKKARRK